MRTVETTVKITQAGRLTLPIPADIPLGEYRVFVVLNEPAKEAVGRAPFDFPVDDCGPWPEGLSLRREDMYGDDGR